MKQSLNSARQQKEALREDNRRLAEIIDQDDRLLPALVQSARDCAADIEETGSEACTLRETARQLEEAIDGVKIKCVNVVKNPGFFKEFYSTAATDITSKSVVVRSGTESRVLTPQSFFVFNEDGKRWGYQGEYRFVSAIMQVTETDAPEVIFTTGHGEDIDGASTLAQLFWDCGFEVKVADLSQDDVGEDCRIIVMS